MSDVLRTALPICLADADEHEPEDGGEQGQGKRGGHGWDVGFAGKLGLDFSGKI